MINKDKIIIPSLPALIENSQFCSTYIWAWFGFHFTFQKYSFRCNLLRICKMKMYSKFSLHRLEGKHPGNFYIVDLPLPQFALTLTHTHTQRKKITTTTKILQIFAKVNLNWETEVLLKKLLYALAHLFFLFVWFTFVQTGERFRVKMRLPDWYSDEAVAQFVLQ